MLSYIVSLYAICPVPRAARLEHFFIAADSPDEADGLARAVFFGDQERRRYTIQMSRASEIPWAPTAKYAAEPTGAPPIQVGFLNTNEQSAPVSEKDQAGTSQS